MIKIAIIGLVLYMGMATDGKAQLVKSSSMRELDAILNQNIVELSVGFGNSTMIRYTFLNAGCICSITQAITGKKSRMNAITTYTFDLTDLKDVEFLIDKPKDLDFAPIKEDIWTIEMGEMKVLVQNSEWRSQQTETNHFLIYLNGKQIRDHWMAAIKKAIIDCKGTIKNVSYMYKDS